MKVAITPFILRQGVTESYELHAYIDSPGDRTVTADVTHAFGQEKLILWSDDAYDAIGDWTNVQAAARALEVFADRYKAKLLPLDTAVQTITAEAVAIAGIKPAQASVDQSAALAG